MQLIEFIYWFFNGYGIVEVDLYFEVHLDTRTGRRP